MDKPRNDSFSVHECGRNFCWISGWNHGFRPKNWHGPWHLQVAHIASGQGRARRVCDRRAVTLLCPLVHDLHVSNSDRFPRKTIGGISYPTIDERHTLWIKQRMDPEYYAPEWLAQYWIGELPQPERPPERWMQELLRHTGIML